MPKFAKVSEKEVNSLKSKTYVLLHDSQGEEINTLVRKALEDYWTVSEYEIIDEAYAKSNFEDNQKVNILHFFLNSWTKHSTSSGGTTSTTKYENVLVFGMTYKYQDDGNYYGPSNATLKGNTVGPVVLWPVELGDNNIWDFITNTTNMETVSMDKEDNQTFISWTIQTLNGCYANGDDFIWEWDKDTRNRKAYQGSKKTILVNKTSISCSNSEIKSAYPYNVELVESSRINAAIVKREDVLVFIMIGNQGGQSFLYCPSDGKYYGRRIVRGTGSDMVKYFEYLNKGVESGEKKKDEPKKKEKAGMLKKISNPMNLLMK
ncbi:MAG: hypothetical protein HRT72_04725 [Flavobacteriales bacterium]|nr:hypothetical protein [Flavobacteriales bacterium]